MRDELPTGTVTFLFTDVEGSTRLLHELGAEGYADALAEHRRVIREACVVERGAEVDTQGDAFFIAFPTAPGALAAASTLTESLASGPISVRVGLHTGTPLLTDEGYVGDDVHRAARIAAAGHGGQVLVSSSTAQLVERDLRDLGEHRLKDLSAPERIYQLGNADFPALKSLYRTNLPVPATPFLGRERELSEVVELLSTEDARLLTLTGPGGTGKTRLALQAAGTASDAYPDGVWWVPLAPLRDAALVLATAAQTLGSKNGLAEHIADKRMLCLFDNFEQVVEAASDLGALVSACPNLDVLVTSRERLRVGGEQTYPVPPLAESDGEALFLTRARAVDPSFAPSEAVGELCLRLDELPLALELAAARTAIFSPEQLLEKLSQRLDLLRGDRDADPRQQTLRATIEWSYGLLADDEQRLFRRLAVFSGGCTYEAADDIAGADPDTLQSLLDKSLLRKRDSKTGGSRYWMLETIREYASEKLEESHEAGELRQRHTDFFLLLAEEAFPELKGSPRPWLDRLEADHDNLRTVLDRLESAGRTPEALQLAGALYRLWNLRGYLLEGRDRLERLLASEQAATTTRVRALHGAAVMASSTGDPETAQKRAEEARDLAHELGDAWGEAYAVYMLGFAATEREDWSGALPFFEASRDAFRGLGDDHYVLLAGDGIAWIARMLGDRERGKRLHEETLARARASGDNGVVALQLWQLAGLANKDGRTNEALAMLREALVLNRDEGYREGIAEVLVGMASTLQSVSAPAAALALLAAAARLREEIGGGAGWVGDAIGRLRGSLRDSLGEAAFESAWKRGRALSTDEAIALALEETERDA